MRHFPTNCYNGAHLDVFRQPSPPIPLSPQHQEERSSFELLSFFVVSSLFDNFSSLIDKNTQKGLA